MLAETATFETATRSRARTRSFRTDEPSWRPGLPHSGLLRPGPKRLASVSIRHLVSIRAPRRDGRHSLKPVTRLQTVAWALAGSACCQAWRYPLPVARKRSPARLVIALSIAAVLAVFLLYTSIAGGTPSVRPSQLQGQNKYGEINFTLKDVYDKEGECNYKVNKLITRIY